MNFFPDGVPTRTLQRGTWPTAAYLSWGPPCSEGQPRHIVVLALSPTRRLLGATFHLVWPRCIQRWLLCQFLPGRGHHEDAPRAGFYPPPPISRGARLFQVSGVKGLSITRRRPGATLCHVSSKYSKEPLRCEFLPGRGLHEDAPTGDLAHRRLSLVGPVFSPSEQQKCILHPKETCWSSFLPSSNPIFPETASQ